MIPIYSTSANDKNINVCYGWKAEDEEKERKKKAPIDDAAKFRSSAKKNLVCRSFTFDHIRQPWIGRAEQKHQRQRDQVYVKTIIETNARQY